MIKFVSAKQANESFKYNFETWFKSMTTVEPIVPKDLQLVAEVDYHIEKGELYISCEGMVKIKTFIHLKQTMDLKDWFENCAKTKEFDFKITNKYVD